MAITLSEIRYSLTQDEVTFIMNGNPGELALAKQTIGELQKLGKLSDEYRPSIYTPSVGNPDLTVSIGPLTSCTSVNSKGPLLTAVRNFLGHFSDGGQLAELKKIKVNVRYPVAQVTGSAEKDSNGGWVPTVKVEMMSGKTDDSRLALGVLSWMEDCGMAALNPYPHLTPPVSGSTPSSPPYASDKSQIKKGILYFRSNKSFPASQQTLAEKEGVSAASDVANILGASGPSSGITATP